ncbi:MAG: metallophosphatase family protein [Deltaproteobacteria bacterium]|nr:metallophosphatase family protein [Deltaproteobacteria bacterium]
MKVGLLSDTHGCIDPGVLDYLRGCDVMVHAGDVGSSRVLDQLQQTEARVLAVSGNNDVPTKWMGSARRLRSLPEEHRIELPGGLLVVEHGHRVNPAALRHERLRARHPEARLVVYGHSHRLVIDRDARPWVVNPGAAGRSRTFGGPSACIVTVTARRWTIDSLRPC